MAVYTVYSSPTILDKKRAEIPSTGWLPEGSRFRAYPGYFIVTVPDDLDMPEPPEYATVVPGYPALDRMGVLAALMVVNGSLSLEDAANAIKCDPDNIVSEVNAWAAASVIPKPPVKRGRKKSGA